MLTDLANRIATLLTAQGMNEDEQRELLMGLARQLELPRAHERGVDWCVDVLTVESLEVNGGMFRAVGNVWWLAGGGEFDRYVAEFGYDEGDLDYCFVFLKRTKNRHRTRLLVGEEAGQKFCEFFDRDGTAHWWAEGGRFVEEI